MTKAGTPVSGVTTPLAAANCQSARPSWVDDLVPPSGGTHAENRREDERGAEELQGAEALAENEPGHEHGHQRLDVEEDRKPHRLDEAQREIPADIGDDVGQADAGRSEQHQGA